MELDANLKKIIGGSKHTFAFCGGASLCQPNCGKESKNMKIT